MEYVKDPKMIETKSFEIIQGIIDDIRPGYKFKNEIEEKINIKDLEATTNVEELTKKAYKIGKTGNIVKDNYNILFTMLFKNKTGINIEFNNEKVENEIEEINKKLDFLLYIAI